MSEINDEQLYEELLNYYGSVIISVDEAIRMIDSHKQKVKQYTQDEIQVFRKINLLFQEIKLNLLIDRNNMMFKHTYINKNSKKSQPQTLAKLLSSTMGLYGQLIQLQKQKSQGGQILQPQKIQSIDAKIFLIRAIRLMLVGQVYFNNDKIKQAYSLWGQSQRFWATIQNSQQLINMKLIDMKQMEQSVKIGRLRCVLKNYTANQLPKANMTGQMNQLKIAKQKSNINLFDLAEGKQVANFSLADYSELQLIDLPGNIMPIPTRPIFFDIYESSIEYPSLDGKLKKNQKGTWWKKLFSGN